MAQSRTWLLIRAHSEDACSRLDHVTGRLRVTCQCLSMLDSVSYTHLRAHET